MARMTRTTLALVAIAAGAPLSTEAQNWTTQNFNGLVVWDRDVENRHERTFDMRYGWYWEKTYFDSNRRVHTMTFEVPAFQQANRLDAMQDTNGDGKFDTGHQWIVGRGWQPWPVSDLAPIKRYRDQAYSQWLASQGGQNAEMYRMLLVRADKFLETYTQIWQRGRNP